MGSEHVPSDLSEPLKLVSSLQEQLDDSYFLRDDACVGDKSYPSIGRRKHTFSIAYLECLYPSQWNPVVVLAENDAKTFDRLESWLQSRQKSGQIASGSYGKDSLYTHTVTALPDKGAYLTFDSTGIASDLWLVRSGRDAVIHPDSLKSWQSVGRMLSSQPLDHGRSLWLSIAHTTQSENGELVHLNVSCASGNGSCNASNALRSVRIPEGFQAIGSDDGNVAMISKDSVVRLSPATGDETPPSKILHRLSVESADDAVVALSRDETLILARKNTRTIVVTSYQLFETVQRGEAF